MKKIWLISIILFFCWHQLSAQPASLDWRSWELLDGNETYLKHMLDLAPRYEINSVQFSHGVVHHAHQLLQDSARAAKLQRLVDYAHQKGLKAFIWTHELEKVPAELVKNGKVQFDSPQLWRWLQQKYEKLYEKLPGLDGLVLTLTETEYRASDDHVIDSNLAPSNRLVKLINAIDQVGRPLGKTLIVRTFVQNPWQLPGLKAAIAKVDSQVIIMSKCVPYDWNPHFPHNPLIGAVAPHPQIVEFDLGQEYNGQSYIPFCAPGYYLRRFKYSMGKGIRGVVLRTARFQNHAIDGPNEINLFTFKRLFENPGLTADSIWQEWADRKYGRQAAPFAIAALKPTARVVEKALYTYGMWSTDQSQVPLPGDMNSFVKLYTLMAQTLGNPTYLAFAQKLRNPGPDLVAMAMAEKDTAVSTARQALLHLVEGKKYFSTADYRQLFSQLSTLKIYTEILRAYTNVLFRAYVLQHSRTVAPEDIGAIKVAMDELHRLRQANATLLEQMQMERGKELDNARRIDRFLQFVREKLPAVK